MRLARPSDIPRLMDFVRDGHHDSALFPLAEDKVREVIERGCHHPSNPPCVIAIIDGPDRIEAAVCLDSVQPWYSDQWLWADRFIQVHYKHRHSRHVFKLMRFVKWWQERTGHIVTFGIETRVDLARKYRFYRRYAPCLGAAFALGVDVGDGNVPEVIE